MLSDQVAIAKLTLKVRRRKSKALRDVIEKVWRSADSMAIDQLARKVELIYKDDPTSAAKYAKPHHWLLLNALRMADLGLHTSPPLRILDIGCGPGFFVALTRALGHQCYGVDAPDSYLTPLEQEVYTTMTSALHCREVVSPLLIERFHNLPFHDQPFDLITAFWVCFNRHRQPDEWGVEEWRYFVDDAISCLRPGGRLMLDLNENPERFGSLRFYDAATLDYFRCKGTVDQGRLIVTRSEH